MGFICTVVMHQFVQELPLMHTHESPYVCTWDSNFVKYKNINRKINFLKLCLVEIWHLLVILLYTAAKAGNMQAKEYEKNNAKFSFRNSRNIRQSISNMSKVERLIETH